MNKAITRPRARQGGGRSSAVARELRELRRRERWSARPRVPGGLPPNHTWPFFPVSTLPCLCLLLEAGVEVWLFVFLDRSVGRTATITLGLGDGSTCPSVAEKGRSMGTGSSDTLMAMFTTEPFIEERAMALVRLHTRRRIHTTHPHTQPTSCTPRSLTCLHLPRLHPLQHWSTSSTEF